ncbi:MAG: efflux RND transporter periplasmic adaptor subunit [Candidatus Dadabacteria bacterium]
MSRKRLYAVAVILVLLLTGFVYYLKNRDNGEKYTTTQVTRGNISEVVTATGTLSAVITVQVGSQVTGLIKTLYVDFNSEVKKGQLIAQIDPDPFQAKVDQARANLSAANAAVGTARANLEKDKANLRQAEINLMRTNELFKKGIVSDSDRVTAQANYDSAAAQVKADEASYRNALANVEQQKANLESAELDLSHTRIISPVDGIVISRNVDVGQTVAASLQAPTLFVIAKDLTKMQIDTNVVEADIGKVKVGQKATFTVDAYPNRTFTGKVIQVRIQPITVQNVVTYDAVIGVENPDLELKPGMTANVSILTAYRENVLKVSNAAFRFHPEFDEKKETSRGGKRGEGGADVWVLSGNGKPIAVPVKTGITDGNFTEIVDRSLKERDRVITGIESKEKGSSAGGGRPPRFGF